MIALLLSLAFSHPFKTEPIEETFIGYFEPDSYRISTIDLIQVNDDKYAVSIICQEIKGAFTPSKYLEKQTVGRALSQREFARLIGSTVTTVDTVTKTEITESSNTEKGSGTTTPAQVELTSMTKEEASIALRSIIPVAEWVSDNNKLYCNALGVKL